MQALEQEQVLVLELVREQEQERESEQELERVLELELVLEQERVLAQVAALTIWSEPERKNHLGYLRQACREQQQVSMEQERERTLPDPVAWPELAPPLVPYLRLVPLRCESCKSAEYAPAVWAVT